MADEVKSLAEEFNWEGGLDSTTKFAGPPPYLGVIIVSEKRASDYEDAKNSHYWQFDVLDVHSKTSYVHRNRVNPSTKKSSKMGLIMNSLATVFKGNPFTAVPKPNEDGTVPTSNLIGRVAWFQQDEESLKYGGNTYPFTKAMKKATDDEVAEGREALQNYVPRDSGDSAQGTIQPSQVEVFEWTDEYLRMAAEVLDGQTDKSVLGAARKLVPAEESGLRNAINAGVAAEVLIEKGMITRGGDGVYHQAGN